MLRGFEMLMTQALFVYLFSDFNFLRASAPPNFEIMVVLAINLPLSSPDLTRVLLRTMMSSLRSSCSTHAFWSVRLCYLLEQRSLYIMMVFVMSVLSPSSICWGLF